MKRIELTRNKYTIVDDDDYEVLVPHKWYCSATGYAVRTNKAIRMHRVVANAPSGLEVDHINGNRLDNRKSNLRIVTHKQNMRNMTKAKGYTYIKSTGRYSASVMRDGKNIFLGSHATEIEARGAYVKFIEDEQSAMVKNKVRVD